MLPRSQLTYSESFGVSDPSGRFFYSNTNTSIRRTDVSGDTPVLLESGSVLRNLPNHGESFLSFSRNSGRVLAYQSVLDATLNPISSISLNGHSITADGQIVVSSEAIYWADTGLEITKLPLATPSTTLAFSSDDHYIVAWDVDARKVVSIPLASLVDLPGPIPRPGQRLSSPPDALVWSAVPGATRYRVFLGTNEAGVTAAGPGSPLQIGAPTDQSLPVNGLLKAGRRYFWWVDSLTPGGTVRGTVHFFDLPFQSTGNPIVQPREDLSYSARFGHQLSANADGVLISEDNKMLLYSFDRTTGEHAPIQTFTGSEDRNVQELGWSTAMGPGLLITGDPGFDEPVRDAGGTYAYRPGANGFWNRTAILPDPALDGVSYFGHQVAFDANQLLITQGSQWQTSGHVFPYFEWPEWRRGPEIVPNPSVEEDFFGGAIAIDGTRALIGAPGEGRSIAGRKGSAFIFDYDPDRREWRQQAHLQPSQGLFGDHAGLSLAIHGKHAALGSGQQGPFRSSDKEQVHVFHQTTNTFWPQVATLADPEFRTGVSNFTRFGRALALHDDLLFISAPYAEWRGQRTGVVYPYQFIGSTWEPLAPIVPPPGGELFGSGMTIHDRFLFVSQFQDHSDQMPDLIHVYQIDEILNSSPTFISPPPLQLVAGRDHSIPVRATDPDGKETLSFPLAFLPAGMKLEDQGNGEARITGTPTGPVGADYWIRIPVTDDTGAEAVQTAIVEILSANDVPILTELPAIIDLKQGEDLALRPFVGGSGPFTWPWKRDGEDLPEATAELLSVPWMTTADSGTYTVTVSNVVASVTSDPIQVTVRPANRFAGDWTTFGSETGHDGHQAATLGRHSFLLKWQTPPLPGVEMSQAVIVGNRIFTSTHDSHSVMDALAHDLTTGEQLWKHSFTSADMVTAPSWHDGRIYLIRGKGTSDSQLWSLNADTGVPEWSTPFPKDSSSRTAPVVSELGAFSAGNRSAGFIGYSLDGSQRFNRLEMPNGLWAPVIHNDRLFTWIRGKFRERDPDTGVVLKTLDRSAKWNNSKDTVPVVKGKRAYLAELQGMVCVDTDTLEVVWAAPQPLLGSLAVANQRVFAVSGTTVRAFSAVDGSVLAVYDTRPDSNLNLLGQPLVLNDTLIVGSSKDTFVFDIGTATLLQRIPFSGLLSYSGGQLVLSGYDGSIRSYFANAAPEFTGTMRVEPMKDDTGAVRSLCQHS